MTCDMTLKLENVASPNERNEPIKAKLFGSLKSHNSHQTPPAVAVYTVRKRTTTNVRTFATLILHSFEELRLPSHRRLHAAHPRIPPEEGVLRWSIFGAQSDSDSGRLRPVSAGKGRSRSGPPWHSLRPSSLRDSRTRRDQSSVSECVEVRMSSIERNVCINRGRT